MMYAEGMEEQEKPITHVYEVGYLVAPTISEDKVSEVVTAIKTLLETHGCFVISDEFPKFRQLAYALTKPLGGKNEKYTSAYFGWIKFEATASALSLFRAELEREMRLVRFLIVKTEREVRVSTRTFFKPRSPVKREPIKTTERPIRGTGMTEAELDKQIEELVVE